MVPTAPSPTSRGTDIRRFATKAGHADKREGSAAPALCERGHGGFAYKGPHAAPNFQ
jgi:hypothetical protein